MGWDDQTRWLRSSDKFTHRLEAGKDNGMGYQTRRLCSSDKFTYQLEMDKGDGMGWDDQTRRVRWVTS